MRLDIIIIIFIVVIKKKNERYGHLIQNYMCFNDSQHFLLLLLSSSSHAIIFHHLLAVHFWAAEVSPATICYTDIGYITPRCPEQHVHIWAVVRLSIS